LVIVTALPADDPIFQADILVEYEQVEIGGKMYVGPSKGITNTTAMTPVAGGLGCAGRGLQSDCIAPIIYRPKDTPINDTVYDSYRVFRSKNANCAGGKRGFGRQGFCRRFCASTTPRAIACDYMRQVQTNPPGASPWSGQFTSKPEPAINYRGQANA
jgi:hypothetical protein